MRWRAISSRPYLADAADAAKAAKVALADAPRAGQHLSGSDAV